MLVPATPRLLGHECMYKHTDTGHRILLEPITKVHFTQLKGPPYQHGINEIEPSCYDPGHVAHAFPYSTTCLPSQHVSFKA